ncbi:MAG: response regulator [Xanthobacteraceae bacterium]|nr:response regulator [Xanthobacteraceae bacterium]
MDATQPGRPPAANSAGLPNDVLIVEDDALIAFDVKETLFELGVPSVRTAASVSRALTIIRERAPDFALLDVGLIREKSFAVAEQLETLKIPFVFVTGYAGGTTFPARFASRPALDKPYQREALLAVLNNWRGGLKNG